MARHDQFITEQLYPQAGWLVESIQLGVGAHTQIVVIHTVKSEYSVPYHLLTGIIPGLHHLICVPPGIVIERRGHVYVLENLESGTDRNRMSHAVSPVLDKTLVQKFTFLGRYTVAK